MSRSSGKELPTMQSPRGLYAVLSTSLIVGGIEPNPGPVFEVQDDCELDVIDSFFSKDRKSPLPIGSIKSNLGTPEFAAGLCGTAKALLCFEAGQLAPNINYSSPTKGSQAISSGRLQVIPDPKPRSEKWISSSVPEAEWDTPAAKLSSAEYHVDNLLKPVLFEEASRHVHNNALTIEIAPHGLLQAILKRCLHQDAINIALTQRGKDSTQVLLSSLGKLYENGLEMDLSKIYPPVEYPVSRGTFLTAPFVKWDHSEKWYVALYQEEVFAWETAVMISSSQNTQLYQDVSIAFENVRFHRPIFLPLQDEIELVVMVQKGSGNFEVSDSSITVVSGRVYIPEDVNKETLLTRYTMVAMTYGMTLVFFSDKENMRNVQ